MSKIIKFYRVSDAYGCFSNFSPHPIYIEANWPTAEHYFQAQKYLDADLRHKIRLEPSPMVAAKMGRNRMWPLRADWDTIKDEIMRIAVRAKVQQHQEVREILLSTGDATIVEHTHNDSYWGDSGNGCGKNMLGIILMEIRTEFMRNDTHEE